MGFHCGIQDTKINPSRLGGSFPAPLWSSFQQSKQLLVAGEICPRDAEIAVAELGSCVGELQKRILALAGGDKSRILYLGHSLVPLTAPWGWFKVKSN